MTDSDFHSNNNYNIADRFGALLDQLSGIYIEDKQLIADISVVAQKYMEKRGVHETLLNIMEGMNAVFPVTVQNQNYSECIAAYIAMRLGNYSHSEAVVSLHDLIADEAE